MSLPTNDPASLSVFGTEGYTIKLETKKALKHVFGVVAAAANPLEWAKIGEKVMDLVSTVSISSTPERVAYQYINTAIVVALGELVEAYEDWFSVGVPEVEILAEGLAEPLAEVDFVLTLNFFKHPEQLDSVEAVKGALRDGLGKTGLSDEQAETVLAGFSTLFVRQLIKTWHSSGAKSLLDNFDHPFQEAWLRDLYYAQLASYYHEPVWGNPKMRLADLYVAPKFFTYKYCFREGDDRRITSNRGISAPNEEPFEDHNSGLDLHAYYRQWLADEDPLDLEYPETRVQLLMGYPGQGKTSFCARLMYDAMRKAEWTGDLYHVKLRDLGPERVKQLPRAPLETLIKYLNEDDPRLQFSLIKKEMGRVLWVIDGLDELFMKSGLSKEDISTFCTGLAREIDAYAQVKVILTSRYGYLNLQHLPTQSVTVHRLELMELKQQKAWLGNFQRYEPTTLTLENLEAIQEKGCPNHHLHEFVNQPILLQMLATSGVELQAIQNRTMLYEQLFDALLERKWSRDKRLSQHQKLKKHHLKDYLSFVALKIYQSPHEYVRDVELKGEDEDEDETKKFVERLEGFELNNALSALMMSFYMRQVEGKNRTHREDENYALEFLHKSLQEYLVAFRIRKIFLTLLVWDDEEEEYQDRSPQELLEKLCPLLGPTHMSEEVHDYLVDLLREISDPHRAALRSLLQKRLPDLVKRDFQGFHSQGVRKGQNPPIDQNLAVFYGYWTVLSHLGPCDAEGNLKNMNEDWVAEDIRARFFYLVLAYRPQEYTPWRLAGLVYPSWRGGGGN